MNKEGIGEEIFVLHPETNDKVIGVILGQDNGVVSVRIDSDTIKKASLNEVLQCNIPEIENNPLKILR